jgi:hypothetical protein
MWFVAVNCKQRGDRNLYADWIILLKEQFSFIISGFLDFVPSSRILKTIKHTFRKLDVSVLRRGEGDTYYVGSLRKSRHQSLDKVQRLSNLSVIHRGQNPSDYTNSFHVFPLSLLISLWQFFKL